MRGVERRVLFLDEDDRLDLLARLDSVLRECELVCFAWALMSNHFHLVVRTGPTPLQQAMKRVMTGYALYFNRRYQRVGHLVQNRYGSRLVGNDADLLVLIRYVHLNPLAARIVTSLDDLATHPWCGHGALMGCLAPRHFHSVPAALSLFDPEPMAAREQLGEWMAMGDEPREPEGLEPARRAGEFAAYRDAVCARSGFAPSALLDGSRTKLLTRIREDLALAGLHRFGLASRELAQWLGLPAGSITRIARRAVRRGSGNSPLG